MIAACPQCQTRYRLAREKIGPQGARIRCSQCQTIFRVQTPPGAPPTPAQAKSSPAPAARPPAPAAAPAPLPPAPPKPLPPLARALVAEVDADNAKAASELLAQWRIEADVVDDGAEALLRMFRKPPALAVLGAGLPSLGGAHIAELAQRASELAAVKLIRIATPTDQSGAPGFDAEEMLEAADFPAGLAEILSRLGIGEKPAPAPAAPAPAARPAARPTPAVARPAPAVAPRPAAPAPAPAPKPAAAAPPPVSSDPAIAAAERLARIAVSDVILYNQEKFAAAAARGAAAQELASELNEARQHFNSRVAPSVRDKRDFLVEEIERRAAALRGS
ncbi:MAG TPA: zinc-ribbon domain-containing protein [Myxococcota bacterium]|nr:zinc-ribbon domain-containing protein [Myxococcota bacterium]